MFYHIMESFLHLICLIILLMRYVGFEPIRPVANQLSNIVLNQQLSHTALSLYGSTFSFIQYQGELPLPHLPFDLGHDEWCIH